MPTQVQAQGRPNRNSASEGIQPTPSPVPEEVTPSPQPAASPSPSPEPVVSPQPQPTPSPEPEEVTPSPTPSPQPVVSPKPTPTPKPSPQPTVSPTPKPVEDPKVDEDDEDDEESSAGGMVQEKDPPATPQLRSPNELQSTAPQTSTPVINTVEEVLGSSINLTEEDQSALEGVINPNSLNASIELPAGLQTADLRSQYDYSYGLSRTANTALLLIAGKSLLVAAFLSRRVLAEQFEKYRETLLNFG